MNAPTPAIAASQSYQRIVETGEKALARWSAANPMRASVERSVAEARAKLAKVSA